MSREILLARRLLEAVVDPDAPLMAAEEAGVELAEVSARLEMAAGRLPIDTFEGLKAEDLSPSAWLLLLEGRGEGEPEVPSEVLDDLFLEYSDAAIRFRLVQGALAQPKTQRRYSDALKAQPEPSSIAGLPDSWPKQRLNALEALARSEKAEDVDDAARALQEMLLYLLQDGSAAARALAAAAVTPSGAWRERARAIASVVVRQADPSLSSYGRAFRKSGI